MFSVQAGINKFLSLFQITHQWNWDKVWRGLLFLLIMLVILSGFGVAHWRVEKADQQIREQLLSQVTAIAETLNPVQLQTLSFTAEDQDNPYFQRLHHQMRAYTTSFGYRSIYTMTLRKQEIIFGAESLNENDPIATPPGTIYQNPPPAILEIFHKAQRMTIGPYHDEYGQFISAYAPVMKPQTDQVLMLVAMDLEVNQWQQYLHQLIWPPLGFSLLLLAFLLGSYQLLQARPRLDNSPILKQAESYITAILGILITLGLAVLFQEQEVLSHQQIFNQLSASRANNFADQLWTLQNNGLYSLSRFMETDEEVSRSEFTRFTHPMTQDLSIQAWEWLPEVAATDKDKLEQQVRQAGLTDFTIFEQNAQGNKIPVNGRDKYYPILYIEPSKGNEVALGYDVNSAPIPQQALREAIYSRQPTATEPLTLIQEPGNQQGLVVYSPIFKNPQSPLSGFTALVIRLQEFLTETFKQSSYGDESVHLDWLEVSEDKSPQSLAASSPRSFPINSWAGGILLNSSQSLLKVYPVFVFGKAYALLFWPSEIFEQGNPLQAGMITTGVGLGLTTLLTLLVGIITNNRSRLTQQVKERTQDLQDTLYQLQERVKEMNCLVSLAQLSQQSDLLIEDFLQACVELLPPAWQYPALTSARLSFDDALGMLNSSVYVTANYLSSQWRLKVEFTVLDFPPALLEVNYREDRPFLPEEDTLLHTVAQFLSHFLEAHYTQNALKSSERNYRQIFNSTHEGIFIHDLQTGQIIDVNEPMLQMHGYESKEEIVGQYVTALSPYEPSQIQEKIDEYLRKFREEGYQVFEWFAKKKNGETFWVEVSLRAVNIDGKDRILAVGRDISDRKRQEQKIQYLSRLYATLSQVNQAIIQNRDRDDLFRAICDVGTRIGKFSLIWFGLIDPVTKAIVPYIYEGTTTTYLENLYISVLDIPEGRGPTGTAAREERLVICEDILHDPLMAPWRTKAKSFHFRSSASVPLRQGNQVIGALTLYSSDLGFFTEDEQGLLQEIGDNISFALDAMQSDLDHQIAEDKLQENEKRLRLALESANQGLFDLNIPTGEAIVSPQYAQMLGYDPSQFQETHNKWIERMHLDDREAVVGKYRAYIQKQLPQYQVEFRQRTADGNWKWIMSRGKIVEWDQQGQPLRMLGIHTDITERKQVEEKIQNLAYYDSLTQLPNRRLLLDRAENALSLAKRTAHYGAILFIDLDRFKTLNDARGHENGDRLLQAVAVRLKKCLRQADTVARLGGDEFIVLLPELSDNAEVAARLSLNVGEKIRQTLATIFSLETEEVQISASIGITLFPKANETVNDLFKEADTAMYQAKNSGRDKVRMFERKMQIEVESRFALEGEIRQALEQKQFQVYLQPQVNHEGHWIGAEALIRWHHPSRGLIPPYVFIPIAEETGLICEIGAWVLAEVCQYLAHLQSLDSSLHIAVNVSPRQFRQSNFVDQIKAILAKTGIAPHLLTLEITEGLIIEDSHQAIATMFELQSLGIHFSIDDFGTGYSSLSYLKRLPLNELKIDRAFVQDAPIDANNAALVEAIISVGHNFNLAIVAEGVETQAQADFLKVRNCDFYQGYLYGKPMPIPEFDSYFTDLST